MRLCATILLVWLAASAARADDAPVLGVVVAIDELDPGPALRGARDAGGARWRGARLRAEASPPTEAPEEAVVGLRRSYLEADFLRCVSRLTDRRLDPTALLAEGHVSAAAAVLVFGGACAHGAEDLDLARALFRDAAVLELPTSPHLAIVSPDVQALAEEERTVVAAASRASARIVTRPPGASLRIDGVVRCERTPCVVALAPGEHVFTASALGFVRRVERRALTGDQTLELALDPAPSDLARRQLADALSRDAAPDGPLFVRAASRALGARLVVTAFERAGRAHAALYDRRLDRVVAESSVSGEEGPEIAVASVVDEWRGETEPIPLYRSPWLWIATIGAAIVAGVIVGVLVIPPDPRHDIVFGN